MYRIILFSFFILSITSCQKDDIHEEVLQPLEANIPVELTPYFEAFQQEAEGFGLSIDYLSSNVTAEIYAIDQGSVAGSCSTNNHNLRHIRIDQDFWNRAPHLLREMVIFHELGHCVLGRGHKEDSFDNGICQSIMRSGLEDCRDAYNAQNRDYFIEELFTDVD